MKKRDLIIVIILSIIIGFMYISGLPLALFSVAYKDIQNYIIPIGLNIILCILIVIFSMAIAPKTFQNDTFFTIAVGEKILKEGITIFSL